MRILYVPRNWAGQPLRKRFSKQVMKRFRFTGQAGFFEASLYAVADVTTKSLSYLEKNIATIDEQFDAVIVNARCVGKPGLPSEYGLTAPDEVGFLRRNMRIPKALLLIDADASRMPHDGLLDLFDLVFKRELLKDRERYDLSERNRAKLRTTMLACPIVRLSKTAVRKDDIRKYIDFDRPAPPEYDVFFCGKGTHPLRADAVEKIRTSSLNHFTGLQIGNRKQDSPRNRQFLAPALSTKAYIDTIRRSKVCLALDGYGQFTYRHIEIWCLAAFMLSSPTIRDITLPVAQPIENEHYVAFDGLDDMMDKIRYYANHESERRRIADAGRRLFERIYQPREHGKGILKELRGSAATSPD